MVGPYDGRKGLETLLGVRRKAPSVTTRHTPRREVSERLPFYYNGKGLSGETRSGKDPVKCM